MLGLKGFFNTFSFFPVKLSIGRQFQSEATEKESTNRLSGAQPFYVCSSKPRFCSIVWSGRSWSVYSLSLWVYDKLGWGEWGLHYNSATTTATTTTTPQNNRFNEQKQSLCTCVLYFGTFSCRPLQNNNMK